MSANGKSSELSPQQALFRDYYMNPKSETFSNAYQSALRAGYEKNYAEKITSEKNDWFGELIRDRERLSKAERVLDKTLTMIDDEDIQRQKLAQDSAKFVAKTMGRHKYAERTETDITSAGKPLPILASLNAIPSNNSTDEDSETDQAD